MDVIERYLDEVLVANETTNLTRIVSRESAEVLHIEDSLSGLNYVNEAPDGPYVDLGTGGGFPPAGRPRSSCEWNPVFGWQIHRRTAADCP